MLFTFTSSKKILEIKANFKFAGSINTGMSLELALNIMQITFIPSKFIYPMGQCCLCCKLCY